MKYLGPKTDGDDLATQSDVFAKAQTVETKTAAYTLATGDAGKLIAVNSASGVSVTVDGSLDLAAGQRIDLVQLGAGQVTIAESGATVDATPTLKLRAQYSAATLIGLGSDTYLLIGDLAAS